MGIGVSTDWRSGEAGFLPVEPTSADYSAEDERTWSRIRGELFRRQDRFAFDAYLGCRAAVVEGGARLPRPGEVSRRLAARTGFVIAPVGGLVRAGEFFACLEEGRFPANTAVRAPEDWRFCPSPDWVHEALGHAAALGDERVAALYRLFGSAAARASDKETLRRLGRLFWYVFEVGLVRESGRVKAFGAAILSSVAEMDSIGRGELRPFDPKAMEQTPYDYKDTQPMYFLADGVDELAERLTAHLAA